MTRRRYRDHEERSRPLRSLRMILALALTAGLGAASAAEAADPVFDSSRLHRCTLELDPADWAEIPAA